MNLQQIEYFCVISKTNNFTEAAKLLNVTQSTLSHSMNDLEKEFNIQLFKRNGRHTSMTPIGEIFLRYAESIYQKVNEARTKLKDLSDPDAGIISVSYFSSLNDLVTFIVSSYYADSGKIQPHFRFFPSTSTEIEKAIDEGSSDIAFTTELQNPNFEYFPIGYHATVVIVSEKHPLAVKKSISLEELNNERFITYQRNCQIRHYIDQILKSANVSPNIIFETTDEKIIVSSVSAMFGVAIIPRPLGMNIGPVKMLEIEDPIPPRAIALAKKKAKFQSRAVTSFAQFVFDNAGKFEEYMKKNYC